MGVVGLSSLVVNNSNLLLKNARLSNCTVVIDGLAVAYELFKRDNVLNYTLGGDYCKYGDLLKRFLGALIECSIKPIVIFDGLLDPDDIKRETRLQRLKDAFEEAKRIWQEGIGVVLPVFLKKVAIEVFELMNIEYHVCCGEADKIIATAARNLNCFVISKDSDFYIFDLPAGYVPFDFVEWDTVLDRGSEPFMNCRVYHTYNLLSHFPGLDNRMLWLVATLCGNDYCRVEHADRLVTDLNLDNQSTLEIHSKRHRRIVAVLQWAADQMHCSRAISYIAAEFEDDSEAQEITKLLESSISMYECGKITEMTISELVAQDTPSRFKNDSISCLVPFSQLLQVLCEQRCFSTILVQDFSQPGVRECSWKLRKATYSLLLSRFGPDSVTIEEYGHDKLKLKCTVHKIKATQMPSDPAQFICAQCHTSIELLTSVPPPLQLFALAVCAWLKNKKTLVPKRHFYALLLHVWSRTDSCPHQISEIVSRLSFGCGGKDVCHKTVHCFSQFQVCLEAVHWLNAAAGGTFAQAQVHRIFEGRILHNLVTGPLRWKPNVEASLNQFLKQSPNAQDGFAFFLRPFVQMLSDEDFGEFVRDQPKKSPTKANSSAPVPSNTLLTEIGSNRFAALKLLNE